MEKYKNGLKNQLYAAIGSVILSVVLIIIYFVLYDKNPVNEFSKGFQFGVAVAFVGASIGGVISTITQMKNPEVLKKVYIKKTDDREKLIKYKSSCLTQVTVLYGALIAMFVALYFSMTVFFTILIFTFVLSCLQFAFVIYYRRVL